jgi:hypothetical protein
MPNTAAEVRGSENVKIKGGGDDVNDEDVDIKRGFARAEGSGVTVQSGNNCVHFDPQS